MKNVIIEVPVRADIAGGSTDISYYLEELGADHGSVVNIALPTKIKVEAKIGSSDGIKLTLPDLGAKIEGGIEELVRQENNNVSQITRHFISLFNIDPKGLHIDVSSGGKIPPASGLGTSSAAGVGVIMALAKLYGITGVNVPELNYLVEMSMGVLGGKQDYYAAWYGGLNLMKFGGPGHGMVEATKHYNEKSALYKWVFRHIIVYYSGQSRSSGKLNSQMRTVYFKTPKLISKIAKNAESTWDAIEKENIDGLKKGIDNDRKLRTILSGEYYTKKMEKMGGIAEKYNFAHRACGAGGGGCMLFSGDITKRDQFLEELHKLGGSRVC